MTWLDNDLKTRCCQYTGIPLHYTGTTLAGAITQWSSGGNPELTICTIGTHWKTSQVHWDVTGTILADASTHWCPSGNPVVICIIWTHGKTNGRPLEYHGGLTGNTPVTNIFFYPVVFHCTLGYKFQAHWFATGLPLNYHWLRVGVYVSQMYEYNITQRRLVYAWENIMWLYEKHHREHISYN